MRICHVNLARDYRGGERQTEMLIRALAEKGVPQRLICRRGSALHQRLGDLESLQLTPISKPFLLKTGVVKGCTLLHVHEGRAGQFGFFSRLLNGTPYLITRRIPNRPKDNTFTHAVYRKALRIVALSRAIEANMAHYDSSLAIEVIPSMASHLPCDNATSASIRQRYPDKFLVGHIGALVSHHKGQQHLIEAARSLRESHPQLHFLLLGKGKDEAWLKEQAKGLDNLTFVGFVDNVGDYLAAFDLFVFPSLEEGLGSILLDAMEYGKAIAASAVDGIPDIIEDDANGLLFQPADSVQLRETIVRLYEDNELRQRLGEEGLRRVSQYYPDAIADRYVELYRRLAES